MAWLPEIKDPQPGDGVIRSVLFPLIGMPLLWVLLIHVGTRIMWLIGYK